MGDAELASLGWDEELARELAEHVPSGAVPGLVARVDRGWLTVLDADGARRVRLGPEWSEVDPLDRPATGDWVALVSSPDPGRGDVAAVLPRRSALVRGDPGRDGSGQVVAANVDRVLIVHAWGRDPNRRRLERELVLAWASGATPVLVLNKADLVDDPRPTVADVQRIAPGVPVEVTSCVGEPGVDALRRHAPAGSTVALIGPSGVGKSTLVNRLVGRDVQATAAVRARDQEGRHTTVARELIPLPEGGWVIDTPGLRAVTLFEADDGLVQAFPDVEELAAGCRFRDCRHRDEPGCAVRTAVEEGRLDRERLAAYRGLGDEIDRVARTEHRAVGRFRGPGARGRGRRSR